jgi:hypothetical protein
MNLQEKLALNKVSSKVQCEISCESQEILESLLLLIKKDHPGDLFYPLHFIDHLIKVLISWKTREFYKHYNWNYDRTKEVGDYLNEESKIYNKIVKSTFRQIKERNFHAEFEMMLEESKKEVKISDIIIEGDER